MFNTRRVNVVTTIFIFTHILDFHSTTILVNFRRTPLDSSKVTYFGSAKNLKAINSPEKQAWLATELLEHKKAIDNIEDPERRSQAMRQFQKQEKRLLLGLPGIQDRRVSYNPAPTTLFFSVFEEIRRTLSALFSGSLNPKWISGPIGIVQVVQESSMSSLKEALYWLGAISLNLGILNLLPIPVLDGGTNLMSLVEIVTRKRLPPKTLEKIVIPFAVLLIGFFIFLTYNDLSRILQGFLH